MSNCLFHIPPLAICSITERDAYKHQQVTHLITIANPGCDNQPPVWFSGEHLPLWFGDVVSEQDAVLCNTRPATSDDIKQAIIFFRVARQQDGFNMLIYCDYGASRSPALAFVLLADQHGVGNEPEALNTLLAIRTEAVPNLLVATLGDHLLCRNGALLAPLKEYFSRLIVQT